MRFEKSDWKLDDHDNINTNTYGTSSNEMKELNRLIMLGDIASVIKHNKANMLLDYNETLKSSF